MPTAAPALVPLDGARKCVGGPTHDPTGNGSVCAPDPGMLVSDVNCVAGNCLIHNLCVALKSTHPDQLPQFTYYTTAAGDLSDVKALLARIGLHPNGRHTMPDRTLHVRIERTPIPQATYQMLDGVGVPIRRLFVPYKQGAPNPGHVVADEVASIFRSISMWELEHEVCIACACACVYVCVQCMLGPSPARIASPANLLHTCNSNGFIATARKPTGSASIPQRHRLHQAVQPAQIAPPAATLWGRAVRRVLPPGRRWLGVTGLPPGYARRLAPALVHPKD